MKYFIALFLFQLNNSSYATTAVNECAYIHCDCLNVEFGLLTPEYKEECRKSEAQIKAQCHDGTPIEKLSCNTIACGPNAYPVPNKTKPTPEENIDKHLKDLCKRLRGEADEEEGREKSFRRAITELQKVQNDLPGMGVVLKSADLRSRSDEVIERLRQIEFLLATGQEPDPEFVKRAAAEIIDATIIADKGGLADPAAQLEMNRIAEKLINSGLAFNDYVNDGVELFEYLEMLQKLYKAGYTAAQIAQLKVNQTKDFIDAISDLFPENTNPVLNGPVNKLFSDQLHWTQDLYHDSTSALDLVAKAIETGHFDSATYQKISDHLETLSATGPWNETTGLGILKKWAEQFPVLGKLVKVFVEDPKKSGNQVPAFCENYK